MRFVAELDPAGIRAVRVPEKLPGREVHARVAVRFKIHPADVRSVRVAAELRLEDRAVLNVVLGETEIHIHVVIDLAR